MTSRSNLGDNILRSRPAYNSVLECKRKVEDLLANLRGDLRDLERKDLSPYMSENAISSYTNQVDTLERDVRTFIHELEEMGLLQKYFTCKRLAITAESLIERLEKEGQYIRQYLCQVEYGRKVFLNTRR